MELVGRLLARIARGQGGELLTRWPDGPGWITALLGPPDAYQVGGTGPQASWALATVGAASVLTALSVILMPIAVPLCGARVRTAAPYPRHIRTDSAMRCPG